MNTLDHWLEIAVGIAWGPQLVVLVLGGGAYLLLRSGFLPLWGLRHGLDVLRGRFDDPSDPGQISHFQALSTALASTIGLGNIGGVAIAITQGGPGAVLWMWLAAVVGMATKFFSCTLAVMYRRSDAAGTIPGGPMYTIELGLGRRWRFLAVFFSTFGLIGCLTIFQSNQVAGILSQTYQVAPWQTGLVAMVLVAVVIVGGVVRIGLVASRLVPAMCALYFVGALVVVARNAGAVPGILAQIVHDAFTGTAAAGGALGIGVAKVIQIGIKRAAFSNEAGLGTAPMAHGAAKTREPVREGLVAMIGPLIDTIVVCSLTAIVILSTGLWRETEGVEGVTLTVRAFEQTLGGGGRMILVLVAALFGFSTMIGYAYYGRRCFAYLFGGGHERWYDVFYLLMLFLGAIWSVGGVINLIDTAFAMMAIPNMLATLVLAPKVMAATRDYFARNRVTEAAASTSPPRSGSA